MCRNIRQLHNFEPPATKAEIHDAALQFVRKVSGSRQPSKVNERVFAAAVSAIEAATEELVHGLSTTAAPRDREVEASKAKARSAARFAR